MGAREREPRPAATRASPLSAPLTPCQRRATRSGRPTGYPILVSSHTPSVLFFLPSLVGDQSPKVNAVAHVGMELGRAAPELTLSRPLLSRPRGTRPGSRTSSCPCLNTTRNPSGLWTPGITLCSASQALRPRPHAALLPAVLGLCRREPAVHRTSPQTPSAQGPTVLSTLPSTESAKQQALDKNVKGKTIKQLQENVGECFCDSRQGTAL